MIIYIGRKHNYHKMYIAYKCCALFEELCENEIDIKLFLEIKGVKYYCASKLKMLQTFHLYLESAITSP